MEDLLSNIRNCTLCKAHLPLNPKPIVAGHPDSKIIIISQAPGSKAHASGIPWDEASGRQLRIWLDVTEKEFYNEKNFAILPMGFCYPGRGQGGDLPPRRECADLWLDLLLARLPNIELTLLIGLHAQRHFLGRRRKASLTATVRAWREFAPDYLPLPHPSARNTPWFQRNPWFEEELLPPLKQRVASLASGAASS